MSPPSDRRTVYQPAQHLVAAPGKTTAATEKGLSPPPFIENIIEARRLQPAAAEVVRASEEGPEKVNPPSEELQRVPTLPTRKASFVLQLPDKESAWTAVAHSGSKKRVPNHHQAPTATSAGVVGKQPRAPEQTPSHHGTANNVQNTSWNTSAREEETICSGHVPDARRAISAGFQRNETPPQQGLSTDVEKTRAEKCGTGRPSDVSHQLRLISLRSPDDNDNHEVKMTTSTIIHPRGKHNAPIDTSRAGAPLKRDAPTARDATVVGDEVGVGDEVSARICEIGYRSGLRTEGNEKVCMKTSGGGGDCSIVGHFRAATSCPTPAPCPSFVRRRINLFITPKTRGAIVFSPDVCPPCIAPTEYKKTQPIHQGYR